MKREVVLFYIECDKIYMYLLKSKKEIIKCINTSFFFNYGEICNVDEFSKVLEKMLHDEKILTGLFKPILYVLYNDVCNCDLKYLYKTSLLPFNYEKINFVSLSDIVKLINDDSKIVYFDKDYYTVFNGNFKTKDEKDIVFFPIYIGKYNTNSIHYFDNSIVWKTFISRFTKS